MMVDGVHCEGRLCNNLKSGSVRCSKAAPQIAPLLHVSHPKDVSPQGVHPTFSPVKGAQNPRAALRMNPLTSPSPANRLDMSRRTQVKTRLMVPHPAGHTNAAASSFNGANSITDQHAVVTVASASLGLWMGRHCSVWLEYCVGGGMATPRFELRERSKTSADFLGDLLSYTRFA